MRAFWESNREQQAKRPAAISFRQVVVVPKPDSAASVRALQLAESLVVALRKSGGGTLSDGAEKDSADSVSRGERERGGEGKRGDLGGRRIIKKKKKNNQTK